MAIMRFFTLHIFLEATYWWAPNEDRPIYSGKKYRPKIDVSSKIRFMQIFAGVRWTQGDRHEIECGKFFGDSRPMARYLENGAF